jgi:hypothetical protein
MTSELEVTIAHDAKGDVTNEESPNDVLERTASVVFKRIPGLGIGSPVSSLLHYCPRFGF